MGSVLFNIIVQPLVLLIDLVFFSAKSIVGSPGIAILCVSFAVNVLCLPLYNMADAQQERERHRQKDMEHWVTHIKKHFKGDERYMMLSTYYDLTGYHPAQALLGSLSLLLQIPFFMAAYSYLSSLEALQGATFLFLPDLGAPDALLQLGNFTINVMPIAMTLFNCVSTAIYTRGLPLRDKVQAYALAALFLVLLYDSPSGLVLYWTCNQIFSLGKNMVTKLTANPGKCARWLAEFVVCGATIWILRSGTLNTNKKLFATILVFLVLQGAILLWARVSRLPASSNNPADTAERRQVNQAFFLAASLLTILIGVLIPSAVIADSPTEFIDPTNPVNPLAYVGYTSCVWGGIFVLWMGTYYLLSSLRARRMFAAMMWCLCGSAMLCYFAFGDGMGTISAELVYEEGVSPTVQKQLTNTIALIVLFVAFILAWWRLKRIVPPALAIGTMAMLALAVPNLISTTTAYGAYMQRESSSSGASANGVVGPSKLFNEDGTPKQILHLSKTQNNVMVFLLDRAISGYVPYMMAERPELANQFDGFTFYPNTMSFAMHTNFAAPPIYGGYEYTPAAMNARENKSLKDKHNEALMLMPTLFSEIGYHTTVIDPPYAGDYLWNPNVSLYDSLPNTEAYYINGGYTDYDMAYYGLVNVVDMNRRFVMYGLLRVFPTYVQRNLYDNGQYLAQETSSIPRAAQSGYAPLDVLLQITSVNHDYGGLVLMDNLLTHEPCMLQLPDYEPAQKVNNEGLEDMSRFTINGRTISTSTGANLSTYHVNMAAFIRLGCFFDWMRANDVYDNTRIILVADHGASLQLFANWKISSGLDVTSYNPLLMVKDLNAHGFQTSDEFMTNADVPTLAMKDIIANPVNPFTGNTVNTDEKNAHPQSITASANHKTEENNGNVFNTSDAPWYTVHDNIFNANNWNRYEEQPEVE